MRITQISKIRNYRIFRSFIWPKDLYGFGQFNLIYGWNGSGKSTLSSIFHHLEQRRAPGEGEIEMELDAGRNLSSKDFSTANLPLVRVFNQSFINATLKAVTDNVEPIYYLGKESVEKQEQLAKSKGHRDGLYKTFEQAQSEKQSAMSALDRFYTDQARQIRILLGGGTSQYTNYNKGLFQKKIQALANDAEAQAAILADDDFDRLNKQKDARSKEGITKTACPAPDFAILLDECRALLERSVVSETLDELARDNAISVWVQRGLELHSGEHQTDSCRFCTQPFPDERRAALAGHFNDAFAQFQHEVARVIDKLEASITSLRAVTFPDSARAYEHLQPALSEAITNAQELIDAAVAWLNGVRRDVQAKRDSPFEPIAPAGWQGGTSSPSRQELLDAFVKINEVIAKHNDTTSNLSNEVIDARKKLELHYVAEAWEEHATLQAAVVAPDPAIDKLQMKIRDLSDQIKVLEREVVEHRRPAEELNSELAAYLGRSELQFVVKENGYILKRDGHPANHLSEGERTAIAFLYFLKTLKDRGFDVRKGVVVIDDPVSSLDANALFSAFGYMKERTKDCGQLFILTHNFGFFRQAKKWIQSLHKKNTKIEERRGRLFFLNATLGQDGYRHSAIARIDPLLEQYESEYHYLFRRVYDETRNGSAPTSLEHYYSMPNVARRLMEAFLAFRYPDAVDGLTKCFDNVPFDAGKKTRILRFMHTYSHSDAIADPEHDPTILAETPRLLGDVLDLMKAVDPLHYEAMERLVSNHQPVSP